MHKLFNIGACFVAILLSACAKNAPVAGFTANGSLAMSNDWWVTLKVRTTDLIGTHIHLATYNTTDNKDSLWVGDPATTYIISGTARTRWLEDDY